MRLFVGIDIEERIRQQIWEFVEKLREFAPDARWVKPETFHVTLKFLGETSGDVAERIKSVLGGIKHPAFDIVFRESGFFPNARNARVFWVGVHADERLPALAAKVDEAVSALGFERERQGYRPHLTLARAGSRASGNPHQQAHGAAPQMRRLQQRLEPGPQPDFGTMTAHEFFLYESKLLRGGAQYSKIARFALE
jgi:RNA 2',3'-cyclic 3'-phosphodiesterase